MNDLPRIEIDPNVRLADNSTYAPLTALAGGGPLEPGQDVIVFESEAGIEGTGKIRSVDTDLAMIYLDVDWASLRPAAAARRTATCSCCPATAESEQTGGNSGLWVATIVDDHGWEFRNGQWLCSTCRRDPNIRIPAPGYVMLEAACANPAGCGRRVMAEVPEDKDGDDDCALMTKLITASLGWKPASSDPGEDGWRCHDHADPDCTHQAADCPYVARVLPPGEIRWIGLTRPAEPAPLDHRTLLAKYIQHVGEQEGCSFIGGNHGGPFTAAEMEELERLRDEAPGPDLPAKQRIAADAEDFPDAVTARMAEIPPARVATSDALSDEQATARGVDGWEAAYELLTGRPPKDVPDAGTSGWPVQQEQMVVDFLAAHGIGRYGLPIGSIIHVRVDPDNRPWLITTQAVGGDMRSAPRCPHCPQCVQQERVVVPLVAPVPLVTGAFYRDTRADVVPAVSPDTVTA